MDGRETVVRVLDACCGLAREGGDAIREVQRLRESGGAAALGAALKDEQDTRSYLTVADVRAQKVIVDGLRERFPALRIVGEEDVSDDDPALAGWRGPRDTAPRAGRRASAAAATTSPSPPASCGIAAAALDASLRDVKLADLCVFVDPVDGTREFVEGRLLSCQTLVGIAWKGRAIAGVVGLPFHHARAGVAARGAPSSASGVVLVGALGAGVRGLEGHAYPRPAAADQLVRVASSKVKEAALVAAHEVVGGQVLVAGGCGNKVLRLLCGQADVAVFNLSTSLWDTCATEALLRAVGGELTDLRGAPIRHLPDIDPANRGGVVATGPSFARAAGLDHAALCARLRAALSGLLPPSPRL